MKMIFLSIYFCFTSAAFAYLTPDIESSIFVSFNDDNSPEYCLPPCKTDNLLENRILSVKVAQYYRLSSSLLTSINQEIGYDIAPILEGYTQGSVEKVSALQMYADDPRVKNICEIGFNAGHSMLNFLVSNPTSTMVTFDIFDHPYSGFGLKVLRGMFPNRKIIAVAGDSSISVPDFASIVSSDFKCQLIYIDGGHLPQQLTADLLNMHALADPSFNRVIVDDLNDKELDFVWQQFVKSGAVAEVEALDRLESTLCISWDLSEDGTYYEFDTGDAKCKAPFKTFGKIAIGQYQ